MKIKSLLVVAATTLALAGYGSAAFADAAAGQEDLR